MNAWVIPDAKYNQSSIHLKAVEPTLLYLLQEAQALACSG